MEELYGWIRNLTGFFLFMSVTENLLPGKAYTKYIRLFSGMVLILLVLRPLAGDLRLDYLCVRMNSIEQAGIRQAQDPMNTGKQAPASTPSRRQVAIHGA